MPTFRFLPTGLRLAMPLALLLAGCESERHPPAGDPSRPGSAAAEVATPELEARGIFFAGQIEVETLLNRSGFEGRGKGGESGSDSEAAGGSGRRGGGGGGRGGGRGRGGGGSAPAASSGDADKEPAPHIYASNLPAVRLHLRLTNHGAALVEVEVTDFDSDLGNFVVQPEKIPLPPNESVEADPMNSRLGLTSSEIPLTVTLRIDGRTETQVLKLEPVKPAAQPASASPAGSGN